MKRKFTIFVALCMLVLTTLVAGCGTSESEKFIGTWEGPSIKDSFAGDGYHFKTIEKLSDTTFKVTEYFIHNGKTKMFPSDNHTSSKKAETVTLDKNDSKVLVRQDGKKIILIEDKKLQDQLDDFTKKSDKILPFNEFNPLPGAPEPK